MSFLNPNVFYMMLLPLILLIILVLTSKEIMRQYFSLEVIKKLQVESGILSKNTRNVLFFIILILFIIALARPVTNKTEQNVKQQLIPIVIALDLSKSMQANDIYPNRVSLAKQKLKAIIQKAKNSTIGVVLFAKDAFILSPVTEDFISLNFIVDNLDTDVNFPNGSNIFATLESTKFMLADFKVKNLIILSDGGNNNEYKNEIEFAKNENIAIYSIGLATKKGSAIPVENGYLTNRSGNIVTVKLNDSIKNLALKTNGGYIDFTLDNSDVDAILNRITAQSKKENISNQNIVTYTELFYFPLGLALFLLLLVFSSLPTLKKQTKSVIVVLTLIYSLPINLYSFEFEFEKIEKAKDYYEKQKYDKAENKYRELGATPQSLYNLANALYKNGKYKEAIDIYSKVISEDKNLEANKLHNIGNSYVKQQNLEKAKEFYEKALKIKNDKETKENLELVNKELKKQKKKQNPSNKEDKKSQNKEQKDQNSSKNKKNNENKNQKKKQDQKKKDSQEQKQQNSQKNNEQKQEQQTKQQNGSDAKKQQKVNNMKQQEISDMEERKWMQRLQNQNSKLFIQKAPTTNKGNSNDEQPW